MGITTVALLAMQTVTAFASVESYNATKLGSITITPCYQESKDSVAIEVAADEAGTYTLYRVGDVVDGSSVTEFILATDFAGSTAIKAPKLDVPQSKLQKPKGIELSTPSFMQQPKAPKAPQAPQPPEPPKQEKPSNAFAIPAFHLTPNPDEKK